MSSPYMGAGRVVRVRKIREEGSDGATFLEWAPDRERSKQKQAVFVCLVLATEPRILEEGENIDPEEALRELGWVRAPEEK